jgi:hypothetical protein
LQAKIEPINIEKSSNEKGIPAKGSNTNMDAKLAKGSLTNVDAKPNSRSKTSSGKAKKKSVDDVKWRLRVTTVEPATIIVTKDTEKEDSFKALKESWEQHQPGRMSMSREIRDVYLKMVEAGNIQSFNMKTKSGITTPWSVVRDRPSLIQVINQRRPKTLSNIDIIDHFNASAVLVEERAKAIVSGIEELQKWQTEQANKVDDTQKIIQLARVNRQIEKERRQSEKKLLVELIEGKQKEMEIITKQDLVCREVYRQRIIKEAEEYSAKLKAAETELGVDDQSDRKGKKKK